MVSDQVVIAAHLIHLGAPSLITVSVSPCDLMRMWSTVQLSDAYWRQAILAVNQHRVSLPYPSRGYEWAPKTQHTKCRATTSAAGVGHGWLMVVPRILKWTAVLAKVITRWGAPNKVITLARACCSFPATPLFGSCMLWVRISSILMHGFNLLM